MPLCIVSSKHFAINTSSISNLKQGYVKADNIETDKRDMRLVTSLRKLKRGYLILVGSI